MAPDRIRNKKGKAVNSCALFPLSGPYWVSFHTHTPPSPTPLLKKRFSTNTLCNTKGFWEAKRSSLYILDPLTPSPSHS